MLKNEYSLLKFGVDTEENEPSKDFGGFRVFGFRGSGVQGFRGSRVQGLRDPGVQESGAEISRFVLLQKGGES